MTQGRDPETRRAEFLRRAAEAFDRTMKEDQEQMITFTQMEDRVLEVGGKLEKWLIEECLAEAEKRLRERGGGKCPKCGSWVSVPRGEPEEREVRGRAGPVGYDRQTFFCPSCRKVFSPSGRSTGDGG